jgi:hypothetical protein
MGFTVYVRSAPERYNLYPSAINKIHQQRPADLKLSSKGLRDESKKNGNVRLHRIRQCLNHSLDLDNKKIKYHGWLCYGETAWVVVMLQYMLFMFFIFITSLAVRCKVPQLTYSALF